MSADTPSQLWKSVGPQTWDNVSEQLCQALDLLNEVKESIPHKPATEVRSMIETFLSKFKLL